MTPDVQEVIRSKRPKDIDPIALGRILWPQVRFYKEQRDIIYSVWDNRETFVKAGNKLGKDFLGGFICTLFFLTRHPCRIVTTSAKDEHLVVLWGEIEWFIRNSKQGLDYKQGGPLVVNHHNIRKIVDGERCPKSYIKGMVASDDSMAAMQGHHIAETNDHLPKTLFVCDEASSVNHEYWKMARSWAHRAYIFGNPWDCNNFFKYAFKGEPASNDKGGDIYNVPNDPSQGYHRKVFTIRAEDSPNVRFGLVQERNGKIPTNEILIPGVKPYKEYKMDRLLWDKVQQSVSLDGEFYEGAEMRMFPQEWLKVSRELYQQWGGNKLLHPHTKKRRKAKAIGVDTAEGGDNTSVAVVDECGLLHIASQKTPDTNVIVGWVAATAREWDVPWEKVLFDISGGGKQHADRMRAKGYNVSTIAFGSKIMEDEEFDNADNRRSKDIEERRVVYKNRRAEMYGNLRELLDPSIQGLDPFQRAQALLAIRGSAGQPQEEYYGFAISDMTTTEAELHRQMSPIPLTYNEEGMCYLIPKHARDKDDERPNLTKLLGCSPDELDALVLGVHGMLRPDRKKQFIIG